MGWFSKCFWSLAAGGGVYMIAILALTIPQLQRNATYAHNVNPTYFQNLSNHENFGFYHHQVQPFTVHTPDNTTLFGWHILPAHIYRKHAAALKNQPDFGVKPFHQAATGLNLQLLLSDANARVIVNFHGNAGHLANNYRPATYQNVMSVSTVEHPVHIITFDYRGFGLSGGSPTEAGVIEDGRTILSTLTGYDASTSAKATVRPSERYLHPDQIVLLGQSMGTFVSTATYHDWTLTLGRPPLKALILMASFSSLPNLLATYSIKGMTPPLLSPLIGYPWIQDWFLRKVVDKWETARRLQELAQSPGVRLDVTILHATDDWEIPWREGERNFHAILDATHGTGHLEQDDEASASIATWTSDDLKKRVRWERIRHGGHNRIAVSEQVKVALLDVFDR